LCVGISHSKSVVTAQRAFRAQYAKDPPKDKTIRAWYKQFTETGCLCKQNSSGRPLTAEELVYRIGECRVTSGLVVHTSNVSGCQKNVHFSCGCEQFH
jgi:hypothetical protein